MEKTIPQLVGKYCNVLGRYGPESGPVQQFRIIHGENAELMKLCDSLDRIKRHLGGSATERLNRRGEDANH